LKAERARIEKNMKIDGYYNFDKQFITYDIDSNNQKKLNLINVRKMV